jgi:hypothetical protein
MNGVPGLQGIGRCEMTLRTKFIATIGLVMFCSLTANVNAGSQVKDDADEQRKHEDRLWNKLLEAESIKAGMTRADLLKVFGEDGGLQGGPTSQRFVLRSCHLIKVTVKFELSSAPRGAAPNLALDNEMKIIEISKPYLEPMTMD